MYSSSEVSLSLMEDGRMRGCGVLDLCHAVLLAQTVWTLTHHDGCRWKKEIWLPIGSYDMTFSA
jgi:hypothetical protein